jgi:poly(hydroxyalkanoate) granule-associated protein
MPPRSKESPKPSASKDSAQQIWLAGLGAFAQAQQEGKKALENLVSDGLKMQRQAQQLAEERIADATRKMTEMAQQVGVVKDQHAGTASWNPLGHIFEDRVAKALAQMGWPTPQAWQELQQRVAALEAELKSRTPAKKTVSRK